MRFRQARMPRTIHHFAQTSAIALLLFTATCQPRPKSPPTDVGVRPAEPGEIRVPPARPNAVRPRRAPPARPRRAAIPVRPPAPLPLSLTLTATPKTLTMAKRARFQVRFTAVNTGARTINPRLHSVRLLVNGRPSTAWMLAIGNGARDRRWYALPPGGSLQMGWPLGKALFPAPGRYILLLQQGTLRSAAVTVTVAP